MVEENNLVNWLFYQPFLVFKLVGLGHDVPEGLFGVLCTYFVVIFHLIFHSFYLFF